MRYKCKKCGTEFDATFDVQCPKCGARDWDVESVYRLKETASK